ncbi:hypothetical protein LINPERPRIM_LOCUS13687 [Linum perenne]
MESNTMIADPLNFDFSRERRDGGFRRRRTQQQRKGDDGRILQGGYRLVYDSNEGYIHSTKAATLQPGQDCGVLVQAPPVLSPTPDFGSCFWNPVLWQISFFLVLRMTFDLKDRDPP